jgi:hypothetical protein
VKIETNNFEEAVEQANTVNCPMCDAYERILYVSDHAMLISRKAIDNAGILDERFYPDQYADKDYCVRVNMAGLQVLLCMNSYVFKFMDRQLLYGNKKEVADANREAFRSKWGCNIDYIKNNQRQGVISSKSTNTLLAYEDAGAASILAYTFENGKLKSIAAVVSTNHASQYASYLSERFLMLPYYKGSDTYFIGADALELENANTVVVMQVYSASQLISIYMPASDYTTSSHSARNIKHLKREVVNIAQKLQL